MIDYDAWKAMQKLLLKFEYIPLGSEESDGYQRTACPICRSTNKEKHSKGCEMEDAISTIGSILYK